FSSILETVSTHANQSLVEAKTPNMGPFWTIPPTLLIRTFIDVVGLREKKSLLANNPSFTGREDLSVLCSVLLVPFLSATVHPAKQEIGLYWLQSGICGDTGSSRWGMMMLPLAWRGQTVNFDVLKISYDLGAFFALMRILNSAASSVSPLHLSEHAKRISFKNQQSKDDFLSSSHSMLALPLTSEPMPMAALEKSKALIASNLEVELNMVTAFCADTFPYIKVMKHGTTLKDVQQWQILPSGGKFY
ncbi:hypothetical protein STEG23_001156, partial [Scotinomys teguina]